MFRGRGSYLEFCNTRLSLHFTDNKSDCPGIPPWGKGDRGGSNDWCIILEHLPS